MRLLIVEDEKRLREVLVKHLKKNNYSVDACATGEEAKEFLAMADYDVAILDVMLPGISGFDVLKWARGQKMEVPVLFLTARDSVEDKVRGLDLGADDYLTKPFAFEELLARLNRENPGVKEHMFAAILSADIQGWPKRNIRKFTAFSAASQNTPAAEQ